MSVKAAAALCLCGLAGLLCVAGVGKWPLVKLKVRREFPTVRHITTRELSEWLADKSRAKPLLLDVREASEFDVSHLVGAQHIEPDADAKKITASKDAPIVIYCSVGYRSAAFAARLQSAGFTNVRNLEGAIFQWANEGRPVENQRGPTDKVHPFDKNWGALLDAARRAE